jgi:hypothetical protein
MHVANWYKGTAGRQSFEPTLSALPRRAIQDGDAHRVVREALTLKAA